MASSSTTSTTRTRHRGRVTKLDRGQDGTHPLTLTITLDEPCNNALEVTTSVKVASAAMAGGIEYHSRVYVTFKPEEDDWTVVHSVELDGADRTQHPGKVKSIMSHVVSGPSFMTVELDKPYRDRRDIIPGAAVTYAAFKRGAAVNQRVWLVFDPTGTQKITVDAVEFRKAGAGG